jgi:hypothetical protein
MSRNHSYLGWAVLLALGFGLGSTAWLLLRSNGEDACHACGRPVHAASLTVGLDDGREETYCCLTCALTHHQQSGETVEVVEVRDYETGQPISPEQAYVVRESDVNLCMVHPVLADREGASTMEFDRCSPSMLAFASRERAEQFQQQHGGILLPFPALRHAFDSP